MVRRKAVQHQRVEVPSGQAMERPVAGPSFEEKFSGPSEASRASFGREQEREPQHEVKPAASSHLQWGSRTGHVTVQAKSTADKSKTATADGPSGVWGAARAQGDARNAGDPSGQPKSGQGRSYKPKAKASGVQRESEGLVATNEGGNKLLEGRGPASVVVGLRGKREGMIRTNGSNFPGGISSEKVRELYSNLWM